jgi:hypothetical protein
MFDYKNTEPVKETEWTRVYKWGDEYVYVSKFLEGDAEVSAESIRERWPAFSFEQKLDFAQAFSIGGNVTEEDERILDFLMEAGDPLIWMTIAFRLPHHRDKDRVLAFLLDRIGDDYEHKDNFFQALGLMKDQRAIPALRATSDRYRERLAASPASVPSDDYRQYLACCEALWRISDSVEYKRVIEDALQSQDEAVRTIAELILRNRV